MTTQESPSQSGGAPRQTRGSGLKVSSSQCCCRAARIQFRSLDCVWWYVFAHITPRHYAHVH